MREVEVERWVSKAVEPRLAEIAGLGLARELVWDPQCGTAGAGVAVRGLGSLGDEVLAELEHAVQEVHVSEAPAASSGASNSRSVTAQPARDRAPVARLPAAAFSASSSAASCADPMCSTLRDPRREDHTIWTAVAPDAVFTVRTYATRRDYEPRRSAIPLVRKSASQ